MENFSLVTQLGPQKEMQLHETQCCGGCVRPVASQHRSANEPNENNEQVMPFNCRYLTPHLGLIFHRRRAMANGLYAIVYAASVQRIIWTDVQAHRLTGTMPSLVRV